MKKNIKMKKLIALAMTIATMLCAAACGNEAEEAVRQDVAETVAQETEAAEIETVDLDAEAAKAEETATPEPTEEPEPLTYVEENGLEYTEEWGFETVGYALNAMDHADYIDVPVWFSISDISVEDAEEDGFKVVTVKQEITGYRWFDGREKKTDVLFPSLLLADAYTGLIIPNETTHYDEVMDEHSLDVEWEDETYHISYKEDAKWDMENEWKPLSDGNFAGWLTGYDTLTIKIPENYNGLTLLLPPIATAKEETASGETILGYWGEDGKDSYLFNPLEMAKELEEGAEASATASTTTDKAESGKTEEAKTAPTPTTAPKQESTKETAKEQPKPAHTHAYNATVTANPTCNSNGTKTFTCSCGDSYTESIPAMGHQWETRTETIHHESTGHMESTPVEKNSFECGMCHSRFDSTDALMDHLIANNDTCNNSGWLVVTETTYDSVWVVDSDAWDETVNYSVCTVCGATQ